MITHTHHFSLHHSLPDVAHYEADNVVAVSTVLGSHRHLIISFSNIVSSCKGAAAEWKLCSSSRRVNKY